MSYQSNEDSTELPYGYAITVSFFLKKNGGKSFAEILLDEKKTKKNTHTRKNLTAT